ncbi:PH domain-containing protein [Streptomyces sp. KS_16]|uniref:PH domain-containing protein n=1 Tax=Streptomyces sp. KS_16 TaxID=1855350 RepID=UPI0035251792
MPHEHATRALRTRHGPRHTGHGPRRHHPSAAPSVTPSDTGRWRRLDPRTLLVHCGWLAAPLGSLALTALATGGRITAQAWITLAAIAASFAVVTTIGLIRWARTEFRVTLPGSPDGTETGTSGGPGRTSPTLDVRSGLLTRRLRSVPLHRIRTVDLTASPLHRLLGVTVLRAGTAGSGDGRSELSLEALTVLDAERLRAELLAYADAEGRLTIRWWPVSAGAGCGTRRSPSGSSAGCSWWPVRSTGSWTASASRPGSSASSSGRSPSSARAPSG